MKLDNVSISNIHNVVRKIKTGAPLDMFCIDDTEGEILNDDDRLLSLVRAVEERLNIPQRLAMEIHDPNYKPLSNNDLKAAAEIFMYLIPCPNLWFRFWSEFYKNLFLTQSTDQIILTLNRMMKITGTQAKDGNIRAEKLLKKITTKLSLSYEEIQRLAIPEELTYVKMEHKPANITISDIGNVQVCLTLG